MLQVTTLSLGELNTNCYLAWCPITQEALIIDPADSAETISEEILRLGLQPLAILLSHGHFDHILGTLELKLAFNLPVFIHQKDLFLVDTSSNRSQFWLKRQTDPVPTPDASLREGQKLEVGHYILEVLELPGHTPGSVGFYDRKSNILFTGDTLFADGVGRTDLSYSSPKDLQHSLNKLRVLPPDTEIFPGHGQSAWLGDALDFAFLA
jgi:hydroxyacylglutathione hydrolase